MKKKPKISYRELVKPAGEQPAEGGGGPESGVSGQGSGPASPASVPPDASVAPSAPDAPSLPNAPLLPVAPNAPRRVSSPIDVAATLRLTPPVGIAVVKPTAGEKADRPALTPDPRPLPPATVEDYATALARRLAAMAPVELSEEEQADVERRPLRERVRERDGVADLLMFRIGEELFATDLSSVEEAVTLPEIHHLPEMPAAMLGAFNLRGRLTPVYSPSHVIGVPLRGAAQAALLVRSGTRRLGLAVDDVEDVFQVNLATVREAPGTDDADGILLGVAHHGNELVAIVDAEALVAACVTGHAMEMTA